MKIASHLKITTSRAKKEISASGYWRWINYLEEEQKTHKKEDHYFARICFELQLLRMMHWTGKDENGNKIEFPFKDFGEYLIPSVVPEKENVVEVSPQDQLNKSKKAWAGFMKGVKGGKKRGSKK